MRSDIAQGAGMYRSRDGGASVGGGSGWRRQPADRAHPGRSGAILAACWWRRSATRTDPIDRARRIPFDRWRGDVEKDPVQGRRHRGDRSGVQAGRSVRCLRRAVADAAAAVERLPAVERAGRRTLQIDRRRRDVGSQSLTGLPGRRRAGSAIAVSPAAPEPGLRSDRRQDRRRALSLGRRRRDLQRRPAPTPRIWQRGWYFGELTVNPANPDQLWVCDTIVLRSDDGGHSFLPVKGDPSGDDFHHLWIDPADPARRILGSDQGAQVTLNGGADLEFVVQPADRTILPRRRRTTPFLTASTAPSRTAARPTFRAGAAACGTGST